MELDKEPASYWEDQFKEQSPELFAYFDEVLKKYSGYGALRSLHNLLRPKAPKGMKSVSDRVTHYWELLYYEIAAMSRSPALLQQLADVINHDVPRTVAAYGDVFMALSPYPFTFMMLALGDLKYRIYLFLFKEINSFFSNMENLQSDTAVSFLKLMDIHSFVEDYLKGISDLFTDKDITEAAQEYKAGFYSQYWPKGRLVRNSASAEARLLNDILASKNPIIMEVHLAFIEQDSANARIREEESISYLEYIFENQRWRNSPVTRYLIEDVRASILDPADVAYLLHVASRTGSVELYYAVSHRSDVITAEVIAMTFREALNYASRDVETGEHFYDPSALMSEFYRIVEKTSDKKMLAVFAAILNENENSLAVAKNYQAAWIIKNLRVFSWLSGLEDKELLALFYKPPMRRNKRSSSFRATPTVSDESLEYIMRVIPDIQEIATAAVELEMWGLLYKLVHDHRKLKFDLYFDNSFLLRSFATHGDVEFVKMLIKEGVVDATANNSEALRKAAEKGYFEIVQLLLDQTSVDIGAEHNEAFYSALHGGHVDVARLLQERGHIDITADGNWALTVAAKSENLESVLFVLSFVNVDVTANGYEALIEAAKKDNVDIFDAIFQYVTTVPPSLMKAIEKVTQSAGIMSIIYEARAEDVADHEKDWDEEDIHYMKYGSADEEESDTPEVFDY